MRLAGLRIFLFDLGEAIFPSRPQFNCAAVSSGGQGWPPLGGHPKGLSLTAASTVAGFVTRGRRRSSPHGTCCFHFPCPLQRLGNGSGKAIKNRAFGLIRKRDPAHRQGMLVYTADGHWSVQLMYPASEVASFVSTAYAERGYEATFGTYTVDEAAHVVTTHVQGALVRTLIGKDLPMHVEFSPDGRLLTATSVHQDQHWSAAWAHD